MLLAKTNEDLTTSRKVLLGREEWEGGLRLLTKVHNFSLTLPLASLVETTWLHFKEISKDKKIKQDFFLKKVVAQNIFIEMFKVFSGSFVLRYRRYEALIWTKIYRIFYCKKIP